jgi:hypothetical protein
MKYHAEYSGTEKVYEVIDDRVILDIRNKSNDAGYYVMPDIEPYRSQLDGRIVNSRSTHRSKLKEHGVIEVGNETKYLKPKPVTTPPGLKRTLIEVANQKLRSY